MDAPPPEVLAAFALTAAPERLDGGQGESFRAGKAVLKRAGDSAEAEWIATLFATLDGPGFRVPRPLRTRDGRWLAQGWSAFAYVDASAAGPNGGRWQETLAACRAFHSALADVPEPAFIRRARHAWAVADRLAWDGHLVEPLAPFQEPVARLRALLRPIDLPVQVIHGDFTANVLFAAGSEPWVIDFSPYWRPARFAEAVVVADAVAWTGAEAELAMNWAAGDAVAVQLLARAVLRRVYELDQHTRRGRPDDAAALAAYERPIAIVERLPGSE